MNSYRDADITPTIPVISYKVITHNKIRQHLKKLLKQYNKSNKYCDLAKYICVLKYILGNCQHSLLCQQETF